MMKKKLLIFTMIIFAVVINLNVSFDKNGTSDQHVKLIETQATASIKPDTWCATPYGFGVTALHTCDPCVVVHYKWWWSEESRCTP